MIYLAFFVSGFVLSALALTAGYIYGYSLCEKENLIKSLERCLGVTKHGE